MSEEKEKIKYYLNKPCNIIHKINDHETLIKISVETLNYDRDEEYCDSEDCHLIANNKYLFDKPCKVNEEIKKIEQVYQNKQNELNKKHNELIDKQNKEFSKLETKKEDLLEKYKKVKGIEKVLDMVFGDYEYIVSLDWDYEIIKKEDLRTFDDKELKAFVYQYRAVKTEYQRERLGIECSYGTYSDGSGSLNSCMPAKNYEEALKILKEYIESKEINSYADSACKKYNINVKGLSEYREKQKTKIKERLKKKKLEHEEEIKEIEEEL